MALLRMASRPFAEMCPRTHCVWAFWPSAFAALPRINHTALQSLARFCKLTQSKYLECKKALFHGGFCEVCRVPAIDGLTTDFRAFPQAGPSPEGVRENRILAQVWAMTALSGPYDLASCASARCANSRRDAVEARC
jgi:hypothetical protein